MHRTLEMVVPILGPWLFVPFMCLLELLVDRRLDMRGVLVNVGWDTSVFSLGLVSTVFTEPIAAEFYNRNDAIFAAGVCFAISIGSIVVILVSRRERHADLDAFAEPKGPTGITAILSLASGGGALLPPAYFHAHALGFTLTGLFKFLGWLK